MDLTTIKNPILYSTMTALAYNINKSFYNNLHYMWCTPYFSSNFDSPHFMVPPSSSPLDIYETLKKEIDGADKHGTKIKLNRLGIRKGADLMCKLGKINEEQKRDIHAISTEALPQQFLPVLCVIPRLEAVPHYKKVEVIERANPMSYEYILADLPQDAFDVIRIG